MNTSVQYVSIGTTGKTAQLMRTYDTSESCGRKKVEVYLADRDIILCLIQAANMLCNKTTKENQSKSTSPPPQPPAPASPSQYCGGRLETDNWGTEIQQYRSQIFWEKKGQIPEVSAKGLNRLQNTCKVFCSALRLFCFTCCTTHYRELYLSDSIAALSLKLYLITAYPFT